RKRIAAHARRGQRLHRPAAGQHRLRRTDLRAIAMANRINTPTQKQSQSGYSIGPDTFENHETFTGGTGRIEAATGGEVAGGIDNPFAPDFLIPSTARSLLPAQRKSRALE